MVWAILYGQRFSRALRRLPLSGGPTSLFLIPFRSSKTNVAPGYFLTRSVVSFWTASRILRLCLPLFSFSLAVRFWGFLRRSWSRLRLRENESWMCSISLVGIVRGLRREPSLIGVTSTVVKFRSTPTRGLPRGFVCRPSTNVRRSLPSVNVTSPSLPGEYASHFLWFGVNRTYSYSPGRIVILIETAPFSLVILKSSPSILIESLSIDGRASFLCFFL